MTAFTMKDVALLEEGVCAEEDEVAIALQRAVNARMWSMQGSYGRAMAAAIEAGTVMLGDVGAVDAYGNRIPSRSQVQEGTKGSRQYVVERFGEDWASMLENA